MSRDYSNTGHVQGTGSFRFARINGKTGQIKINFNGDSMDVGGLRGYIDGFDYYEDPGNPDHQIAPHKGITIFLSATCPFTQEQGVKFKFDQSLHNAVIGPTIMNALLGEEGAISNDTMVEIGAWMKNDYARCKIEIDGRRSNLKFPYNDETRWFDGVPRPEDTINPVNDMPIKVWKKVYAFWSEHAQAFVGRMKTKFGQVVHPDQYADAEQPTELDKAIEAAEEKFGAMEKTPAATIGQVELTGKLAQVQKITDAKMLVKAYDNMLKYNLAEGQLKMAKGTFTLVAGKIGAGLEFTDTGAVAIEKPVDDSDELPF